MPFGDHTGPSGMGPRSGRGFGFCSGYSHPGFVAGRGRGFGRGMGPGFGRSRGWGRQFGPGVGYPGYAPDYGPVYGAEAPSPDQEKSYLKSQISAMETTIENLKRRLEEVDKQE